MIDLKGFKSGFEDYPEQSKNPFKQGGKAEKMATKETATTSKKYNKTQGEHAKDIVIAVLITGVIAFVGGLVFANKQQARVDHAVSAVTQTATPKVDAQTPASK